MSWLSELKWSNRLEHLYAMIAGDEELDETVPSTYDRKQGFLFKIAEKIAELSEGGGGGGGERFEVVFSWDDESSGWVCNRTMSDVAQAYADGKDVRAFAFFQDIKRELLVDVLIVDNAVNSFTGRYIYMTPSEIVDARYSLDPHDPGVWYEHDEYQYN